MKTVQVPVFLNNHYDFAFILKLPVEALCLHYLEGFHTKEKIKFITKYPLLVCLTIVDCCG